MSGPAISQACPAREEWSRFRRGDLPVFQLESLAEHFESCATCQAAFQALPDETDDLLLDLRHVRNAEPSDAPSWQSNMAALEASSPDMFADTRRDRLPTVGRPEMPAYLGEYRIVSRVGRGGMGAVYRAVHTRLDKVVAIKVLQPERLGDAGAVARFQRELRAVGKLNHPNIVLATDAGQVDGALFLVMEFIEGIDLAQLIKQHTRVPVAEACELARQAALGLQYAHSHGLVHRDVKPSNLLLASAETPTQGLVKIADLGLALLRESESDKAAGDTSANVVIGTLDYIAPEQADNAHQVDHRADLYSLGCTLYELLSGKPPFAVAGRQTRMQKLKAHADAAVPSLAGLCPKLPAGLETLLRRLLAKDPEDRFATAAAVAAALQPFALGAHLGRLLGEQSSDASSTAQSHGAEPPRRSRLKRVSLGCAGALLAAAVIYVQTNRGTLEIQSDDDEVKVRVEQDGKLITLVDLKTNKQIHLRSGTYEVALGDNDHDLALDANEFTLHRGGKEVLRVRRQAPTLLRAPFDAEEAKRHQQRWSKFRGVPEAVKGDSGLLLTLIPPGEFEMRSGYHVKITKPYYLGTHEVTVGQFRAFIAASGYTSDLEREGRGVLDIVSFKETLGMNWRTEELALSESHPVAGLTWYDAEKFCAWLSEKEKKKYRLPTEAEWEWAARSGSMSTYGWGDDEAGVNIFAWHEGNSDRHSQPIGGKRPNAWGLHDTNGNLVEWCQDWAVAPYPTGEVSDPRGPALTNGTRTLRGGSFLDTAMTMTSRGAFGPTQSMIHCGFRVCREL
jgi:eukaryotic-like serine/threonine-protein kinase